MSDAALPILSGIVVLIATFVIVASVYALLAMGLNVQWGNTGLFNAGIAAFFAIGAYVTAIFITPPSPPQGTFYPGHLGGFSLPWLLAVPAAGAVAGLAGLLIAIPTLRLRTDYLAIATLGLAEISREFLSNDQPVTGGVFGIYGIPALFPTAQWPGGWSQLLLALTAGFLVVVVFVFLYLLGRTPWTRVLKSIREDEDAAEVLGKDTFVLKLQSFVLGCVIMGIAGSLFTEYLLFLEPVQSFQPFVTFTVWAMLILGGSGNYLGAILGAFVFYFADWFSTNVQINLSGTTGLPSTAPILAPPAAVVVAVLPLLVLDALVVLLYLRPRWLRPGGSMAKQMRRLAGWVVGEAFVAWVLIYSLVHPDYIGPRIVYFRIMLVGLMLIILMIYRPQGLLREKLVTVRRRSS